MNLFRRNVCSLTHETFYNEFVENMKFGVEFYIFLVCGVPFVASFSWKNCGNSIEPLRVISLDVYLNQTKTLYVTGRIKVARNITAPIQGNLLMQKKFFWGWMKIPCVDEVGSCTYEDVCKISPYLDKPCPPEFIEKDLPCRCPILKGQYAGKKIPIDLNFLPKWIEEGIYRIRLTLNQDQTELICIIINIKI